MPEGACRESKSLSVTQSILLLCEKLSELETTISDIRNGNIINNKHEKAIPVTKPFEEVWNSIPQQMKELTDRVAKINEEIRQIIF